MYRKDKLPEELHDLLGLRIVLTPAASSGIDTDADAVEEGRGRRKGKARAALRGHTAKTKGALPPASSYVETGGEGGGAAGAIVEMVTTTSRAGTATAVAAVAAVATAAAGSSVAGDSRVEEGGFFGVASSSSSSSSSSSAAVGGGDGWLEGRALEAWLCHGVRELIVDMWEEVPGVRLFHNLCVSYVCIGGADDPIICLSTLYTLTTPRTTAL